MKKIFLLLVCILAILLSGCKKSNFDNYCKENNYNILWKDYTQATTSTGLQARYIALVENNEGDLRLLLLDKNHEIIQITFI